MGHLQGAPTMPTPSDHATLLVEVLVHDLGQQPGDEIPDHRLKARYQARGHGPDEIADGLKQAHSRDWIRWESGGDPAKGRFFLTEAGFKIGET
jgi:hypothetical protein